MTAHTVELALRQLSERVRAPRPDPRLRDQLLDDYRALMGSKRRPDGNGQRLG